MIEWRGGFGDLTVANPAANQLTLYFDLARQQAGRTDRQAPPRTARSPPAATSRSPGSRTQYFAAVFLPEGNSRRSQEVDFQRHRPHAARREAGAVHRRGRLRRRRQPLRAVRRPQGSSTCSSASIPSWSRWWISAGCRSWPSRCSWSSTGSTTPVVHNFGWSIVVVTIVINFVLFPLKLSNMKSMRKMQALKPQIDAINAKYKNISLRDPQEGASRTRR